MWTGQTAWVRTTKWNVGNHPHWVQIPITPGRGSPQTRVDRIAEEHPWGASLLQMIPSASFAVTPYFFCAACSALIISPRVRS